MRLKKEGEVGRTTGNQSIHGPGKPGEVRRMTQGGSVNKEVGVQTKREGCSSTEFTELSSDGTVVYFKGKV